MKHRSFPLWPFRSLKIQASGLLGFLVSSSRTLLEVTSENKVDRLLDAPRLSVRVDIILLVLWSIIQFLQRPLQEAISIRFSIA